MGGGLLLHAARAASKRARLANDIVRYCAGVGTEGRSAKSVEAYTAQPSLVQTSGGSVALNCGSRSPGERGRWLMTLCRSPGPRPRARRTVGRQARPTPAGPLMCTG